MFKKVLQIIIVMTMCLGIVSCASKSNQTNVAIENSIEKVSEVKMPDPFEDVPQRQDDMSNTSSVVIIYGEFVEENSNL